MGLTRPLPALNSLLVRPFTRLSTHLSTRPYSQADSPKAPNPRAQDPKPSIDKEHPGPPPAAVGIQSSSSPSQSDLKETSGKTGMPSNGAQPKILDERGGPGELSEDTKKHNAEMDGRYDNPVARDGRGEDAGRKGRFFSRLGSGFTSWVFTDGFVCF